MVRPKKYFAKPTAIDLIRDPKNKEIVEWWFLEYLNQPDLTKKLNPEKYKQYKGSYKEIKRNFGSVGGKKIRKEVKSSGNSNKMSELFKTLKEKNYFFEKTFSIKNRKKHSPKEKKKYLLNSEFFLDFAKKELEKDDFTEEEKNWIAYYLNKVYFRHYIIKNYDLGDLIEKIKFFLLDLCILQEINFYQNFFDKTLDEYGILLNKTINKKYKEVQDSLMLEIGEWRVYGSDEKQTKIKREIGKKVKKLFGFNVSG